MPSKNGTLVCRTCDTAKRLSEFYAPRANGTYDTRCKNCERARGRIRAAQPKVKVRQRELDKLRRADPIKGERLRQQSREHNRQRTKEQKMFTSAKARARKNGLAFELQLSDILIPEHCPLLDIPITPGNGKPHAGSPSLDRIDPAKGYVPPNVWVISYRANAIKQDAYPDELEQIARRVREELGS